MGRHRIYFNFLSFINVSCMVIIIRHDYFCSQLHYFMKDAPAVTVDLSNTDPEEDTSLLISCKATGRPNRYTYTSMFQTLGAVSIPNTHLPANGIIDIKNLKIKDSGTYTCLVNNGIADRNNKLDQTGNVTVVIKASPKVLLEDTKSAGATSSRV
ncbi:uncharacterized protein LOC128551359 [Mercenaria mercenaria]|uniref:uncharacterized protein LOC128551359 n=1 Tax=Mercenaria mercenaria TaxID=6596 RepID=UPI00234F3401|nr:uncharacterized protein LOC128551359 [Mercenaria mercenaria]